MSYLKFRYNRNHDAWSWVLVAKKKDAWGLNWRRQVAHMSDELLAQIVPLNFPQAQKIVGQYIASHPRQADKHKIIRLEITALQSAWQNVEEKYFKALAKIMGKPLFRKDFVSYVTTGFMCPYNEKEGWFMVSMWHSLPYSITTICHEVLHLQFLFYYKKYLEQAGLKKEEIENLKEALTFLLNEPEFEQIILCQDEGYPEHRDLRKKLRRAWLKHKNFEKLVEQGTKMVRK